MAQRVFKMNGRKYYSIMDMAREVGVPRIYSKDFATYGIVEITGTPEADEPDSPLDDISVTSEPAAKNDKPVKESKKNNKKKKDTTVDEPVKKQSTTDKSNAKHVYTMEELVKMSLEEFSSKLKKIETSDVVKFASENGVETFDDVTDDRIKRMKVVMELKKKFFPGESLPVKKASFKGVDTSTLMKFADDNNVEYKKTSEDKIQKMWVIYALNKAGYYDLPDEDGK